jgi:protein TonB
MATMAAPRMANDSLKTPLIIAGIMHAGVLTLALLGNYFAGHQDSWGGPGGAVQVGVVGRLPAIPLPQPDVQTPNRVVDNTKGLYQSEPKKAPVVPPDATEIPKFLKNKPPKIVTPPKPAQQTVEPPPKNTSRPSKLLENDATPPPNAVPYGGGGAPTIPRSSSFTMGSAGVTQGGLSFSSGAGGGDFGSRFSWYVTAVQQRVSNNWLQSSIDSSISWAPRVVVNFDILRDGTITNIQITQSSNNYSVDSSARRAVELSSKLAALPSAYQGSSVGVEFYFDYKRQ